MAKTTVMRPARQIETRAIASNMPGIAINPSMMRMMIPSAQRMYPETRPITMPMATEMTETATPTARETRAP